MKELNDKDHSWEVTENSVEINNKLTQIYVDAVRNTRGNNKTRLSLCGIYLNAANEEALEDFQLAENKSQTAAASNKF